MNRVNEIKTLLSSKFDIFTSEDEGAPNFYMPKILINAYTSATADVK